MTALLLHAPGKPQSHTSNAASYTHVTLLVGSCAVSGCGVVYAPCHKCRSPLKGGSSLFVLEDLVLYAWQQCIAGLGSLPNLVYVSSWKSKTTIAKGDSSSYRLANPTACCSLRIA